MKKAKRILALIGVIFLVAMYLSTLIFSLIDSPLASDLLKGSVAATITDLFCSPAFSGMTMMTEMISSQT